MDVNSLYTNVPQEEGILTVCRAYEEFYHECPSIPTRSLKEMLCLILQENAFHFKGKDYLQTHGTAMGTKMAVAFANIFMAKIEKEILGHAEREKTRYYGKGSLTMCSHYGAQVQTKWKNLFKRQTTSTKLSSLRLKFQKKNLPSWTRKCTKVQDSTKNLSLTCKHTTNLLGIFNRRIFTCVTHQASQRILSREKHSGF